MKRILYLILLLIGPLPIFGMHIAEGFLPMKWAIFWAVLFIPFLIVGFRKVKKLTNDNSKIKLLFAVAAAFVFILSSLKLPSVAGSSSHLTGIALGAILFGASGMSVVGLIVLLFQALLLAHGGITTLGANAFSMSVVGAVIAVWIFHAGIRLKIPQNVNIFLAAFFSDICIYLTTSFQLASAFHADATPWFENMLKFISVFLVTQLPLAVAEGILTVFIIKLILKYNKSEVKLMNSAIQ